MRIYVISVLEGQEWIVAKRDPEWVWTFLHDGPHVPWKPPQVDLLRTRDDGSPCSYSDFPWFLDSALTLKRNALDALSSTLKTYGYFLPLKSDEAVWLFLPTVAVDALDEEASEIVRYDDGSILEIDKHVFKAAAIGETELFRLPGDILHVSPLYVQQSFVRRVGTLGLSGIAFNLVWSDEDVPAEQARVEYVGSTRRTANSRAPTIWRRIIGIVARLVRRP